LLYLSDRETNPSKLDRRQRERLKVIKEDMLKTALIDTFTRVDQLQEKIRLHLLRVVRELKARGPTDGMSNAITQDFFPITKDWSATQRQIAVCIADIKGFTVFSNSAETMGSGRIDKLLAIFFTAIDKAFRDGMRNLEGDTDFQNEIRASAVPTIAKPLGDGAMIVWEFSEIYRDHDYEIGMILFIIDFVRAFQDHFYSMLNELKSKSAYTTSFTNVNVGIGLSYGKAWKTAGLGNSVDYVGTPVREAFRLQELAKPCGVVAKLIMRPHLFMERCCAGDGDIYGADHR
jgi:class 3 adenylate cyclase